MGNAFGDVVYAEKKLLPGVGGVVCCKAGNASGVGCMEIPCTP